LNRIGRALVLGVLALALLLPGQAALADPARPTHYRSSVTSVLAGDGTPTATVTAEVVGGDAYLVLTVPPGRTVEVPGYEGEAYLRFTADGRVEVNTRSPARWLNDARFGALDVEVPAIADVDAPPQWELVATGGRYAWHDHRIHFMSPTLPADVDPSAGTVQEVFAWEIPLLLDGEDARIEGVLVWMPGPAPAVPLTLLIVTIAAAGWLSTTATARRGVGVLSMAMLTLATGIAAGVLAPPGADTEPVLTVFPAIAVAVWFLARIAPGAATVGSFVRDAAAVPLLGWGLWWSATWWRPVPPTALPIGLVRLVVAAALAVGIAGVVALLRRGVAAASLDREPGDQAPEP
jgi:hypothetical protein